MADAHAAHRSQPPGAGPDRPAARGSLVAAVEELSRLHASAERLQHALSPLLQRGGEAAEAAQALDEITQHLRGLGEFLTAVARACPPDWRLDPREAADPLRLHAQKLRLTSVDAASPETATSLPWLFASGDLELW